MMGRRSLLRTAKRRRRSRKPFAFPSVCVPKGLPSQTKQGYHEVSYPRHGEDPRDVLLYRSNTSIDDLDPCCPPQPQAPCGDSALVRVEMMYAPWNPADTNTVQGRYPSPYGKSAAAAATGGANRSHGRYFDKDPVIGSEGWGRVTHSVSGSLPPGTLVALGLPGLGSLRSSAWVPESAVLPIPEEVSEALGPAGCSLLQLGGTALGLLSRFVGLGPGDTVVQNAGNSGVGFLASQMAASPSLFGRHGENNNNVGGPGAMVSLVRRSGRSRESFDECVAYLESVGKNAIVVAEEDFFLEQHDDGDRKGTIDKARVHEMKQKLRMLSPTGSLPKLALNAVGGDSAGLLLKLLEANAESTMVTYGGMSGRPLAVATPQLVFGDVRLSGYWHSRWMVEQHEQERSNNHDKGVENENSGADRRAEMADTLSRFVLEEGLKCPPARVFRLEDLQEGLAWQKANRSAHGSNPGDHRSLFPVRTKLVWDCREQNPDENNNNNNYGRR